MSRCATEVRRTTLGRYIAWCITHQQALADPQRRPEQAEAICAAHKQAKPDPSRVEAPPTQPVMFTPWFGSWVPAWVPQ